jgi:hypothetical protein
MRQMVAVPPDQGGGAGVCKQKFQRQRFDVTVAKNHVGFANLYLGHISLIVPIFPSGAPNFFNSWAVSLKRSALHSLQTRFKKTSISLLAFLRYLNNEFHFYAIARVMLFHHGSCNSVSRAENSPLTVFTVNLFLPTLPVFIAATLMNFAYLNNN